MAQGMFCNGYHNGQKCFNVVDLLVMAPERRDRLIAGARQQAADAARRSGRSWHVLLHQDPRTPALVVTPYGHRGGWVHYFSAHPQPPENGQ